MFFASEERTFVKKVLTDDTGSNRVLEMSLDISGVGFVRILRSTIVFRDVCLFVGGFRVFVQSVFLLHPPEKKKLHHPPGGNLQVAVACVKKISGSRFWPHSVHDDEIQSSAMYHGSSKALGNSSQPGNTRRKNAPKGCGWLNTRDNSTNLFLHCFSRFFFWGGDFWKNRILGSGFIGRLSCKVRGCEVTGKRSGAEWLRSGWLDDSLDFLDAKRKLAVFLFLKSDDFWTNVSYLYHSISIFCCWLEFSKNTETLQEDGTWVLSSWEDLSLQFDSHSDAVFCGFSANGYVADILVVCCSTSRKPYSGLTMLR